MPPPEYNAADKCDPMFTKDDCALLRSLRISPGGGGSMYRRPGTTKLIVKDGKIQVDRDGPPANATGE